MLAFRYWRKIVQHVLIALTYTLTCLVCEHCQLSFKGFEFPFNRRPKWRHSQRECQTNTRQTWGFVSRTEFFSKFPFHSLPSSSAVSCSDTFGGFLCACVSCRSFFFFFTQTSVSKYCVTQTLCNHNHTLTIWASCGRLMWLSLRLRLCFYVLLFSVTLWWMFDVPIIVL